MILKKLSDKTVNPHNALLYNEFESAMSELKHAYNRSDQ